MLATGPDSAREEAAARSLPERVDRVERRMIEDALRSSRGNVAQAAEALSVPKKTLYDKLRRHDLDPDRYRSD